MMPYSPAGNGRKSLATWRPALGQQAVPVSDGTKENGSMLPAPHETPAIYFAAVTLGVIALMWGISQVVTSQQD